MLRSCPNLKLQASNNKTKLHLLKESLSWTILGHDRTEETLKTLEIHPHRFLPFIFLLSIVPLPLPLSLSLSLSLSLNCKMEAELPVREASTSSGRRSFTVPLTRYAARLFTRHPQEEEEEEQQQPRSEDEESGHDYSYYNENGSYCCYWYYWKAIMVVDLVWNLGFVVVALVVLLSTFKERPSTPLRLWLFGYSLQCLFHVAFVYLHFLFRNSSYSFSHNRSL